MHIIRFNFKRISIWILIPLQVLAILTYFYWQPTTPDQTTENKILFLKSHDEEETQVTYHKLKSNIILKSISTKHSYVDFNSSLCFKNGTDLSSMKLYNGINWKCNCLPGWHGSDCGQPEVLWRAFLTNRKPVKIKGPRTFQRRLIYLFRVDKFSEYVADIRINELGGIVDLFILCEDEKSDFLRHKLDNKYWKEYQTKILYIRENGENLWKRLRPYLKNIRNDDIILASDIHEIPNKDALIFLKFYDQWPQPIKFRLRWSVFGFFWKHPSKTIISGGACTLAFLKESFNNKLKLLTDNKTLSSPLYKGIVLGDLNHYGGWFCEYCNDPAQIVEFLVARPRNVITGNKRVDSDYIEELIDSGVYTDGKTQLTKAHKYSDNYFAPKFVCEHDWKYDFLMINLYSKLDYYEG